KAGRECHSAARLSLCYPTVMLVLLMAPLAQHPTAAVCPQAAAVAVDSGWRAYRSGALQPAAVEFAAAQALCPSAADPAVGAGFVLLRQGRAGEAERLFRRALAADSTAADGWYGLGVARGRLGRRRDGALARADRRGEREHGAAVYHPPTGILSGAAALE